MKLINYFFVVILICSCSNNTQRSSTENTQIKDTEKTEKEKEKDKERLKEIEIKKIISENNIQYSFDSSKNIKYSIDFKNILKSNSQLITSFRIMDIYEKDSSLYVFLKTGEYFNLYFHLEISEPQKEILFKYNDDIDNDLEVVIKLNSIVKLGDYPKNGVKVDEDGDILESNSIHEELKRPIPHFIGTGKILKIIPINSLPK